MHVISLVTASASTFSLVSAFTISVPAAVPAQTLSPYPSRTFSSLSFSSPTQSSDPSFLSGSLPLWGIDEYPYDQTDSYGQTTVTAEELAYHSGIVKVQHTMTRIPIAEDIDRYISAQRLKHNVNSAMDAHYSDLEAWESAVLSAMPDSLLNPTETESTHETYIFLGPKTTDDWYQAVPTSLQSVYAEFYSLEKAWHDTQSAYRPVSEASDSISSSNEIPSTTVIPSPSYNEVTKVSTTSESEFDEATLVPIPFSGPFEFDIPVPIAQYWYAILILATNPKAKSNEKVYNLLETAVHYMFAASITEGYDTSGMDEILIRQTFRTLYTLLAMELGDDFEDFMEKVSLDDEINRYVEFYFVTDEILHMLEVASKILKMERGVGSTFNWEDLDRGPKYLSDDDPIVSFRVFIDEELKHDMEMKIQADKFLHSLEASKTFDEGEDVGTMSYLFLDEAISSLKVLIGMQAERCLYWPTGDSESLDDELSLKSTQSSGQQRDIYHKRASSPGFEPQPGEKLYIQVETALHFLEAAKIAQENDESSYIEGFLIDELIVNLRGFIAMQVKEDYLSNDETKRSLVKDYLTDDDEWDNYLLDDDEYSDVYDDAQRENSCEDDDQEKFQGNCSLNNNQNNQKGVHRGDDSQEKRSMDALSSEGAENEEFGESNISETPNISTPNTMEAKESYQEEIDEAPSDDTKSEKEKMDQEPFDYITEPKKPFQEGIDQIPSDDTKKPEPNTTWWNRAWKKAWGKVHNLFQTLFSWVHDVGNGEENKIRMRGVNTPADAEYSRDNSNSERTTTTIQVPIPTDLEAALMSDMEDSRHISFNVQSEVKSEASKETGLLVSAIAIVGIFGVVIIL